VPETVKNTDEFLRIARERWTRSEEAEKNIREAAEKDLQFLVGKQWPEGEPEARRTAQRPALTINKLPPFVSQVTNEQRKNRAGAKVSPQGEGADKKTAEIYQGLIRHIEYISQADVAYDTAFDYAVSSGYGYWRYATDYVSDRSTQHRARQRSLDRPDGFGLRGSRLLGRRLGVCLRQNEPRKIQAAVPGIRNGAKRLLAGRRVQRAGVACRG
jgi:hypothetical protein